MTDPSCGLQHTHRVVTLAHGGGGRAMGELLRSVVVPALGTAPLAHDGAVLELDDVQVALTTDAFVVHPRTFPGGDIGRLAVLGTCNDLWVTGAVPRALSLALILEEGLELDELAGLLRSVRAAAEEAGVQVVTGDTKVVDRGKGDGAYLVTTGLGRVLPGVRLHTDRIRAGDVVLVSGDVGRHGVAVLSVREGLAFDGPISSDCADLGPTVRALLGAGEVHCARDATRGGVGAVLAELAWASGHDVAVDEAALPLHSTTRGACEILGLDPMFMACEGRLLAWVPAAAADGALAALRALDPTAARLGEVVSGAGDVWLRDAYGGERSLVVPYGTPLPRIC